MLSFPHAQRRPASNLLKASLLCTLALLLLPAGRAAATVVGWGPNFTGELGAGYTSWFEPPVGTIGVAGAKQVVSTYHSSYALMGDGTVRAWGGNTWGQLGDGNRQASDKPVQVLGLSGVTAIAAGGAHAMALLANGTVATWGGNMFGQLGNGTSGHGHELGDSVPVIVPGLDNVVAIAAGGADDFALLRNGTLEGWGENRSGQLGDGTTVEKDVPTPVRGLSGVKAVASGGMTTLGGHTLALLENGTVVAWGAGAQGQLGNGQGAGSIAPVPVKGLANVVAISASVSHSLALLANGTVMAWGNNSYGEIGAHTGESCGTTGPCARVPVAVMHGASAISAGFRFSEAIGEGLVYGWGRNVYHQLGPGSEAVRSTPALVQGVSEATSISAGEFHSLAMTNGLAPAPMAEALPGPESVTLGWRAPFRSPQAATMWTVTWRPRLRTQSPWTGQALVAPSARSYTVKGLTAGVPYELNLRGSGFVRVNIEATPLP